MMYAQTTVVLKTLLDDAIVKPKIDAALSTYPVYTPKNPAALTVIPTREDINKRLLNHYKYREIGFETVGRFLDELEIAMCDIMPYYNQLFKSEDIINGIDDIFGNLDVTEEYTETTTGSSQSEGSGTSSTTSSDTSETSGTTSATSTNNTSMETSEHTKNIKSETPQDNLAITAKDINNVDYADEVNWNKKDNTSTSEGSETSSGSSETSATSESSSEQSSSGTNSVETETETAHTLHRKGNQGVNTYAHDMLEFRQLFMNIVSDIIHDKRIANLFMKVY